AGAARSIALVTEVIKNSRNGGPRDGCTRHAVLSSYRVARLSPRASNRRRPALTGRWASPAPPDRRPMDNVAAGKPRTGGLAARPLLPGRGCHPGNGRVLMVEDDDAIAEPLVEGLTREGFDVNRVANGTDALGAPTPDAVLLDLGLPDIDGYAVCRQLR